MGPKVCFSRLKHQLWVCHCVCLMPQLSLVLVSDYLVQVFKKSYKCLNWSVFKSVCLTCTTSHESHDLCLGLVAGVKGNQIYNVHMHDQKISKNATIRFHPFEEKSTHQQEFNAVLSSHLFLNRILSESIKPQSRI